jgi:hypothetical protein
MGGWYKLNPNYGYLTENRNKILPSLQLLLHTEEKKKINNIFRSLLTYIISEDPMLCGTSIAPTSQVRASVVFLLPTAAV